MNSTARFAYTITLTLAMRPIGALVFGWTADRYGRRIPLMIDVTFYSIVEVLSGLAPDYSTFLVLRVLYGIGMGGEWGVGASLAMEVVPAARRGLLSGLLQEGYAIGYLLAAAAYLVVFPALGWRALFLLGGAPALLVLYIRSRVPESPAWQRSQPEPHRILRAIGENFGSFLYLTLFMTMLSLMFHGTQDMYPTFLEKKRALGPRMVATIAIVAVVVMVLGAVVIAVGRERAAVDFALTER
jgi:MFS transporter, SHS family, lactate transporter